MPRRPGLTTTLTGSHRSPPAVDSTMPLTSFATLLVPSSPFSHLSFFLFFYFRNGGITYPFHFALLESWCLLVSVGCTSFPLSLPCPQPCMHVPKQGHLVPQSDPSACPNHIYFLHESMRESYALWCSSEQGTYFSGRFLCGLPEMK